MGLLDRFIGRPSSPPAATASTVRAMLYGGRETLEVVGESHYQDALWQIVGGRRAEPVRHDIYALLVPNPENPYDANAIEVRIEGHLVGHLSREDAVLYRPGLLRLVQTHGLIALEGTIVGGGPRRDGIGFLGVFLDHDPADFGLTPQRASNGRGIRTGFAEAAATDPADDSYDLSWYSTLSSNDPAAIKQLRILLENEHEPIDRHYMLCELESRLYRGRDGFASALEEFDAACRQHDEEMSSIRPALLSKFGVIPVIDMYRQASIRWRKARDWQAARDWAERGITVYGSEAARPEVVEDLHKRVAHASAKIEAATQPRAHAPRTTVTAAAHVAPEMETLVCESCGSNFERARTRGRKPKRCPACRGEMAPAATA